MITAQVQSVFESFPQFMIVMALLFAINAFLVLLFLQSWKLYLLPLRQFVVDLAYVHAGFYVSGVLFAAIVGQLYLFAIVAYFVVGNFVGYVAMVPLVMTIITPDWHKFRMGTTMTVIADLSSLFVLAMFTASPAQSGLRGQQTYVSFEIARQLLWVIACFRFKRAEEMRLEADIEKAAAVEKSEKLAI